MKLRSSSVSILISLSLVFIPSVSIADKKAASKKKVKKVKIYRIPQSKTKTPKIVYRRPNKHSKIVIKLPTKTRWIVRLPGKKTYSRSTWLHVSWNNKKGWMDKKHLVFDSQATDMAAKNPDCVKPNRSKSCDPS